MTVLKSILKMLKFTTGSEDDEGYDVKDRRRDEEDRQIAALVFTNLSGRIGRLEGKATLLITLNLMVLGILLQQVFQGG